MSDGPLIRIGADREAVEMWLSAFGTRSISHRFDLAQNATVHRAAANDIDFRNRTARGSVCNGLLFGFFSLSTCKTHCISDLVEVLGTPAAGHGVPAVTHLQRQYVSDTQGRPSPPRRHRQRRSVRRNTLTLLQAQEPSPGDRGVKCGAGNYAKGILSVDQSCCLSPR